MSSLLYKCHKLSAGCCWRISLKAMADTVTSGALCVRMCRGAPSGTELASIPGTGTTNNYVMINQTSRLLIKPVRYGVLKVVSRRSTAFCDVTPCSLVEMYWKQTTVLQGETARCVCKQEYNVNSGQNTTKFICFCWYTNISNYNYMFRPFLVTIIRLYIPSFKSYVQYAN